jgi:hypothetical protein
VDEEANMQAWTLFEYLYRDAGNFKAFGSVAFDGALTERDLTQARARFGDGFLIAEQLGIPALYEQLYQYSAGPTNSDHCWHEFLGIRTVVTGIPAETPKAGSATSFLARLLAVEEWDEELSPHFRLDA